MKTNDLEAKLAGKRGEDKDTSLWEFTWRMNDELSPRKKIQKKRGCGKTGRKRKREKSMIK